MSSVIDERVVQMSFDNDQFEKGVSQTINSLNKLDKTLVDTADGEYFTKMEEQISKVEQAFTKSGMVINGILIGIGQTINQYINKGLAALTSGIRSGMQEYETQMGATQTILANVKDEGKGIDDVTAALDELNTYADKTIYNFTEMTRNIGMFTAAGANLDTSVATIKGLANAAALVGANATTAARAWYQVSQAMAAGSFKLMDWRSLEISNIAGEGFKSVLTEVARKDGLAVAKMIDNGTALRDTLKDGWLTAERFAEAMKILSGDLDETAMKSLGYTDEQIEKLIAIADEAVNAAIKVKSFGQLMETTAEAIGSGWAVTFRTIIGDFERARTFFTRVSISLNSIIDKISDYRNRFLDFIWNTSGVDESSAYTNFKRTIDNLIAIFSTFIGSVRAGFDNVFSWLDIRSGLGKFTGNIQKFTKAFVLNDTKSWTNYLENKEKINKAIADGLDPDEVVKHVLTESELANYWDLDAVNENIKKLIRVFRGLFSGIDIIFTTIGDTIGWVIDLIPGMDNFFGNLKDGNLTLLDNLANIMDKVTMIRDMIIDLNLIPNILNLIKQSILDFIKNSPILMGMINGLAYAEKVIKAFIDKLKEINISPFNILVGAIKMVGGAIAAIFYGISEAISKIVSFFTGKTDFSFFDAIGKEIGIFIVLLGELGKGTISVAGVFDYYKQKVIKAFESIIRSPFVEGVIKFFTGAWNSIKNFWNTFVSMLTTLGTYISNFYNEYFGDYEFDITKVGIFGALTAIGVMLYKLSKDIGGWASIGARIADVLDAIASRINSEALLNIAYAVGILAASIFVLSLIPIDKLMDTVSMIVAVMLMFIALFAVIKKTFDAIEVVKNSIEPIEKMGLNLSKGLQRFIQRAGSALLLEAIGDAFLKIAGSLVAIALAFQFMPEAMDKAIAVFVGIGVALAAILVILTAMTSKGIDGAKGFKDVSDLLNLGITSFLGAMSQAAKMVALAVIIEAFGDVMIKMAAALSIIASVAKDNAVFLKSLVALLLIAVLMGALVTGLYTLSQRIGLVKASVFAGLSLALIAFSGCLITLSIVAAILGKIPFGQLATGVGAISVLAISLGAAIRIMTKYINGQTAGVFMSMAAVFLALGAGMAAVIYTSTLIQNGTQIAALSVAVGGMIALIGEMIGLVAVLKTLNVDYKVILSLSAIVGTMALAFVGIGVALNLLNDVHVSPSALLTVAAMMVVLQLVLSEAIGLGILAAVAEAVIPGVGYVAAAAIGAIAAMILSFGVTVYLLSLAILNVQEALSNFFDVLIFLSTQGEYFISTIKGAGETIVKAVPSLFGLFMSIGAALGTAISAILLGVQAMLESIVLQACTMILQIIVLVSDWINSNQDLILTAFSKLWAAILNLAIIALKVALQDILPSVLSVIFNFFSLPLAMRVLGLLFDLYGLICGALGDFLKNSGIPILEWLGDVLLGQAAKTEKAVGRVMECIGWLNDTFNWLLDALGTLIGEIDGVTASVDKATGAVNEMNAANESMSDSVQVASLSMANAISGTVASITKDKSKFVEVNTKATNEYEKNTAKIISLQSDEVNAYNEATNDKIEITADGISSMFGLEDGFMGDVTSLWENGLQLDLDNQDSFWTSFLNGEKYYGEQYNGVTVGYLLKNTDLLSQYYTTNSELAGDYYDKMAEYSLKMSTATDNSQRQAALDYKKKYVDPLADDLKKAGYGMKQLLNDGIDWELTPQTKKKQEETFNSWTSMFSAVDDYMKNYKPSEVDTSMYSPDFGSTSGTDTSKLQEELKDRNDIIGKADSEIQPKDLTPTIDLDSLKNEVNQANGIMTGSLLAAQNAAIGDYINTDSELNPFLKDRWQNVYNFTQNNYSPKALSRIDIYRQTQNQLRLSRGM